MNSGIYLYKFDSGKRYIGQAVDMSARREQHIKKMQTGKHTKLIQQEYDYYGLPSFYVLADCHPNHLDWMEALYIDALSPELNTVVPNTYKDALREVKDQLTPELLNSSVPAIINKVASLKAKIYVSDIQLDKLKAEKNTFSERILQVAKEKAPVELQEYVQGLEAKTLKLEKTVDHFTKLPWWRKMFYTV
jgi:hypothetical protein